MSTELVKVCGCLESESCDRCVPPPSTQPSSTSTKTTLPKPCGCSDMDTCADCCELLYKPCGCADLETCEECCVPPPPEDAASPKIMLFAPPSLERSQSGESMMVDVGEPCSPVNERSPTPMPRRYLVEASPRSNCASPRSRKSPTPPSRPPSPNSE
jgi:hypothetical protein